LEFVDDPDTYVYENGEDAANGVTVYSLGAKDLNAVTELVITLHPN
jgi:hypothetical protein